MIEGTITSVIGLPTTSLLHAVENKTLNPSEIVSKTGYGAEIWHVNAEYFTTSDYNKFAGEIFSGKMKKGVVIKYYNFESIKNSSSKRWIKTRAR